MDEIKKETTPAKEKRKLTPAEKKAIWENVRMVLILAAMATPFIFLVIMCISYFL